MPNFTCNCGKCFKNKVALSTHLQFHCPINTNKYAYNKAKDNLKKMSTTANTNRHIHSLNNKNAKLLEWQLEHHTCERCHKVMVEKYGSGRFCLRSCANSRTNNRSIINQKISLSIKNSKKFFNSINTPRKIFAKSGYYKGIYCASTYELVFLIYCKNHSIDIIRNTKTFKYTYNNKEHLYLPDFYLGKYKCYVELKGRGFWHNEDITQLKQQAVLNTGAPYLFIDDTTIQPYIQYVKNTYKIKHLVDLYD